jgi:hypothetical protein
LRVRQEEKFDGLEENYTFFVYKKRFFQAYPAGMDTGISRPFWVLMTGSKFIPAAIPSDILPYHGYLYR